MRGIYLFFFVFLSLLIYSQKETDRGMETLVEGEINRYFNKKSFASNIYSKVQAILCTQMTDFKFSFEVVNNRRFADFYGEDSPIQFFRISAFSSFPFIGIKSYKAYLNNSICGILFSKNNILPHPSLLRFYLSYLRF